jgi:hypothetical protein
MISTSTTTTTTTTTATTQLKTSVNLICTPNRWLLLVLGLDRPHSADLGLCLLIGVHPNTRNRIQTSSPRIYNMARLMTSSRTQAENRPFHRCSCTRCHSVQNHRGWAHRSLPPHRGPGTVEIREPSSSSAPAVLTRPWNRNLNPDSHRHRLPPRLPPVGSWLCRLSRKSSPFCLFGVSSYWPGRSLGSGTVRRGVEYVLTE